MKVIGVGSLPLAFLLCLFIGFKLNDVLSPWPGHLDKSFFWNVAGLIGLVIVLLAYVQRRTLRIPGR